MRPDAVPKFCKSRSVPFSIKEVFEEEVVKLERAGILETVTYREWAAPIVAVPKKDGKIRICGDYKVTVNQALEVDKYNQMIFLQLWPEGKSFPHSTSCRRTNSSYWMTNQQSTLPSIPIGAYIATCNCRLVLLQPWQCSKKLRTQFYRPSRT